MKAKPAPPKVAPAPKAVTSRDLGALSNGGPVPKAAGSRQPVTPPKASSVRPVVVPKAAPRQGRQQAVPSKAAIVPTGQPLKPKNCILPDQWY